MMLSFWAYPMCCYARIEAAVDISHCFMRQQGKFSGSLPPRGPCPAVTPSSLNHMFPPPPHAAVLICPFMKQFG